MSKRISLCFVLWVLLGMSHTTSVVAFSKTPKELVDSGYIRMNQLTDYQDDQQLKIDADIDIHLTPEMREALNSEIPLSFWTELELNEAFDFFGLNTNRNRETLRYQTELRYSTYQHTYMLVNHRNKKVKTFSSLQEALKTMGTLDNFRITDLANLHPTTLYTIRLRMHFNPWRLPTPLVIQTWLGDGWRLDSGWHEIEIHSPDSWY